MDAIAPIRQQPIHQTPVGLNRVIHGDCVRLLRDLPRGSVDLVFADPPFNIGYEYDVYDDRRAREDYLKWSGEWISAVYEALAANGTFWLAIGDEYAAELKVLSRDIGFHTRSWVIWYYTFGVNCSRKFTRSHAHLFHFVKDAENFTFRDHDFANRIPSARQLVYGDKRANSIGRLPDDTWILRPQDLVEGFTAEEDVWYFPRVAGTFKERAGFHGCQMPEQLLGRIIRTCSEPEGLVVDPFSGSATTAAVAKKLGRRHLAFDLSEEYVRLGNERLDRCRFGDPLTGSEEPRSTAPATPPEAIGTNVLTRGKKKQEIVMVDTADDLAFENGLLRAFRESYGGYSLDRVLTDPALSSQLEYSCRSLGLPGDAQSWFRSLLRMRKAGRLQDCPAEHRTEISWEESDRFVFGCEIALRKLADLGSPNVDDILCDPALAARFDRFAADFAPGFTPFQYRWTAVKLRKEGAVARKRAEAIASPALGQSRALVSLQPREVPEQAGVYLLTLASDGPVLFAGATFNLRARLEHQFAPQLLALYGPSEKLHVRILPLDSNSAADLTAYQASLQRSFSPRLNVAIE